MLIVHNYKIINQVRASYNIIVSSKFHCTKIHNAMDERIDDNRFEAFQRVCDEIAEERSYIGKAKILQNFFRKGVDGKGFKGDTVLWVKLLVPGDSQSVYNLQNKQMLKLFSRLFACDVQKMQLDLEQGGDVSETLRKFFESSVKLKPQAKSTLYLQDVDEFLKTLEQKTKEDEQSDALRGFCRQATSLDLKWVIRLVKQDLRINAGARHILDAFGPFAYPAYQSSRNLASVVKQFAGKASGKGEEANSSDAKKAGKKIGSVQVMTPISPMLANACKSVDEAIKKCPNGFYSEVKYDGERVQIHKKGDAFKFFSRNLKPVMDHKVKRFKEFIPKAFPGGFDMILDSEIILVDTKSGELLPFGTLGAHKKKEYANAEVCLFVFDCILLNGEDLTNLTLRQRREILEEHIKPVKSYVQLSESRFLKTKNELALMTAKVLKANLEGVVLKDPASKYQPGKRGWLKVKKDYLFGGKMADTADLVVMGAWFGSGKKGGVFSIYLMCCYDKTDKLWKTVTKVHSGLDDATQEEMHEKLLEKMERADPNKVPAWLLCHKSLVPDYIAKSPTDMPVWEITGAEFTKSEAHTAAGISIRFPRITKLRDDKSAEQANDLQYLKELYDASKKDVNVDLLMAGCKDGDLDVDSVEIGSKLNVSPSGSEERKRKRTQSDGDDKEEPPTIENEKDESKKSGSPELNVDTASSGSRKKQKLNESSNSDTKKPKAHKQLKLDFSSMMKKVKARNEEKTEVKDEIDGEIKSDSNGQVKVEANGIIKREVKGKINGAGDGIFKGMVAYFVPEIVNDELKELFSSNGGTISDSPDDATIAFHEQEVGGIDMKRSRQQYRPSCRHLTVNWLKDSSDAKKCLPYPMYAVVLD